MKKLILSTTLLLFSIIVFGQKPWITPNSSYGTIQKRQANTDAQLFPTGCGEPVGINWLDIGMAAEYFDSCGGKHWIWNPKTKAWQLGGNGSGTSHTATVETDYLNATPTGEFTSFLDWSDAAKDTLHHSWLKDDSVYAIGQELWRRLYNGDSSFVGLLGSAATNPMRLITTGGISNVGNVVTLTGPTTVQCDEGPPVTVGNYVITVPAAADGFHRTDAIVFDCAEGQLDTLQGIEDEELGIPRTMPAGILLVAYIDVFGPDVEAVVVVSQFQRTAVGYIDPATGYEKFDSIRFNYSQTETFLNIGGGMPIGSYSGITLNSGRASIRGSFGTGLELNTGSGFAGGGTYDLSKKITFSNRGNVYATFSSSGSTAHLFDLKSNVGVKVASLASSDEFVKTDASGNFYTAPGVAAGWSLTGNTGTSSSNFIGTIDNQDLYFRIRNEVAGKLEFDLGTTAFGLGALKFSGGFSNEAFGLISSGSTTSGQYNTSMGESSNFSNVDGSYNTAFGMLALADGASYSGRTGIGYGAKVTANNATAIGINSVATTDNTLILADTIGTNVGIGNTTPQYKLDVTGDINVTGNYRVNGTPVGGGSGTVTSIATSNGITGGTITGTGTISGVDAAADGTTKGVAAYTAADFNASSGVISIDYTNGQAASGSQKGFLSSADWSTFNGKGAGTVTSVAALTLGTSGSDLSSSVANGTTTPVITLNVPTATASNRGALSSTDWSTFNGKQDALISATNIKTINGSTILGSGDLSVSGGVTTMATIGSSPNNNGASISGSTLTLQPADATHGGMLMASSQTIGGNKTFTGLIETSSTNDYPVNITGTVTGSPSGLHGFGDNRILNFSGRSTGYCPFDARMTVSNSVVMNHIANHQAIITFGTNDTLETVYGNYTNLITGTGTLIKNYYGILAGGTGTGTVKNYFGLRVPVNGAGSDRDSGFSVLAEAGRMQVSTPATATARWGTASFGGGPWDSTTTGFFNGNGSGQILAINAASSFTGSIFTFQKAGTNLFNLGYAGDLTLGAAYSAGVSRMNVFNSGSTTCVATYGSSGISLANGLDVGIIGNQYAVRGRAGGTMIIGSNAGTCLTISASNNLTISGDVSLALTKKFTVTTGTNASAGTGTLSSGAATISTTAVSASSLIFIQYTSCTSCGSNYISAKSAGTSFTVTSSNGSDASTFNWWIIN